MRGKEKFSARHRNHNMIDRCRCFPRSQTEQVLYIQQIQGRNNSGSANSTNLPSQVESCGPKIHEGVSENSVALNPMVNDHYLYEKWLFHWEYTQHFQTNPRCRDLGWFHLSLLRPLGDPGDSSSEPQTTPARRRAVLKLLRCKSCASRGTAVALPASRQA